MRRIHRLQTLLQFDRRAQRRPRLKGAPCAAARGGASSSAGLIAGVDEAGRGPLAGPVVAGAVLLHDHRFTIPVDDSKQLSPLARERAYCSILRYASIGIGAAGAEEIDRIGIHAATHLAMIRALKRLPVEPDLVLVDGNSLPRGCILPMQTVVQGDSKSLSIACASIVAKVVRDQWMGLIHRLHPEYGFLRHKGYGTDRHIRLLKAVGPCRFHRFTFRPIRPPSGGVRHRSAWHCGA